MDQNIDDCAQYIQDGIRRQHSRACLQNVTWQYRDGHLQLHALYRANNAPYSVIVKCSSLQELPEALDAIIKAIMDEVGTF
jgi:hypothetical protein